MLPPNAKKTERAIESATARLGDVDAHLDTLRDPDAIPATLLPWLAWDRSVDLWDSAWTEVQKRAVVRSSIRVHQHKGTAGAMIDALAALDYTAVPVEWFAQFPIGAPYTFRVDVEFTTAPITAAIYDEVERIALSAKNARSHLTSIRASASQPGGFFVGGGTLSAETTTVYPRPS